MQIPSYWAEARVEGQVHERKRVVRRFGWSDESRSAAELHARQRAEQAMTELQAGQKVAHRERKLAYGKEGMPIREEIVARSGTEVVTRNAYGARCLNEPDVLFADLDLDFSPSRFYIAYVLVEALALAVALSLLVDSTCARLMFLVGALVLASIRVLQKVTHNQTRKRKQFLLNMHDRIDSVVRKNPDMLLAIYETPAGMRVLALHGTYDPKSSEASRLFTELKADPAYTQLCQLQACFRSRVSPKPWRIGITTMEPRGVWPVPTDSLPRRTAWITNYEQLSRDYAACRFVEEVGTGQAQARCLAVQRMHDEMCRARTDLPIA